jgi:ATP-dependent protease ClpP protease subunit
VIVPNHNFRPSPDRALYVTGEINEALVSRLTPRITLLQSRNRNPISVYIDSPGGSIVDMEGLWKLLNAGDQDGNAPCVIITVVTTRAASAAADLLSSGDWAVAYPHSVVLYHGSRLPSYPAQLTLERAALIAYYLRITNEKYAMDRIRKIEVRFMQKFLLYKSSFADVRKDNPGEQMTDADCFLEVIKNGLSTRGKKLFDSAINRYQRYEKLLKKVKARTGTTQAKLEAARLKAIIDFEVDSNKKNPDWSFTDFGLTNLSDDFFLVNEHLADIKTARLTDFISAWGKFALTDDEKAELDGRPEEERLTLTVQKVRPILEPVWAFFVSLCHALSIRRK